MNLTSSDGKILNVDEATPLLSISMEDAIFGRYYSESAEAKENHQQMVMVEGIKSDLLEKVMEYCEKHSMKNNDEDMEKWDSGFVNGLDRETLEDLIRASKCLRIRSLHVLLGKKIATLRAPRKAARRSELGAAMISPLKKERNAPRRAPWFRTRVGKRCSETAAMALPIKKRREAYACSEYVKEDGMEESTGENFLDIDHQLLSFEVEREDDDAKSTSNAS
ncbi:hypothetical protein NE237_000489 [Protea cynaroides]|uniref:SKP1 component POZ domain-containing protein n=1 Tax=Protea cynaroides TaxID=273540 RepID=A0A9Q0KRC0_9MAGN|nr:hypothetical protein NE237_000489 [Protea cynaroides]